MRLRKFVAPILESSMLSVRDRARLSLAASALRVILFVVLLGGGLMTEQYRVAQDGSLTRLYEDVRDHHVDVIEYRYHVSGKSYDLAVRWSTGPFSRWEHQEGGGLGPVPQEAREAFPEDFAGPQGSEFEGDLRRAMGDQKIDIRPYRDGQRDHTFWIQGLPEGWQGVLVAVVALALFGVMLTTRDHRYANRWAWFWMFLFNPLGMLGYLWLEKRPFPPPLPSPAKAPIGGGVGFCYAIGLSILFVVITTLATWLIT
jgi:hypothetical protein